MVVITNVACVLCAVCCVYLYRRCAGTSCARYRSDGRILVTAHWDHAVRVYDRKHLKPLAVLRYVVLASCYTLLFVQTVDVM